MKRRGYNDKIMGLTSWRQKPRDGDIIPSNPSTKNVHSYYNSIIVAIQNSATKHWQWNSLVALGKPTISSREIGISWNQPWPPFFQPAARDVVYESRIQFCHFELIKWVTFSLLVLIKSSEKSIIERIKNFREHRDH